MASPRVAGTRMPLSPIAGGPNAPASARDPGTQPTDKAASRTRFAEATPAPRAARRRRLEPEAGGPSGAGAPVRNDTGDDEELASDDEGPPPESQPAVAPAKKVPQAERVDSFSRAFFTQGACDARSRIFVRPPGDKERSTPFEDAQWPLLDRWFEANFDVGKVSGRSFYTSFVGDHFRRIDTCYGATGQTQVPRHIDMRVHSARVCVYVCTCVHTGDAFVHLGGAAELRGWRRARLQV